jgi:hypothetical protein
MQGRLAVRNWIQLFAVVSLAVTMTRGQTQPVGQPLFGHPSPDGASVEAAKSSTTRTIPYWTNAFSSGAKSFGYSMVGASPISNPSTTTTVETELQPLTFRFANALEISGSAAASAIANSPLFVDTKLPTGTGQYIDLFQRANFAKYVGSKPYHVRLGLPSIRPEIVINVPKASGSTDKSKAGVLYGLVDGAFVTKTILNLIKTGKFNPTTLPIFVAGDVFEYNQVTVLCCVLGYHEVTASASGELQTYIYTSFPTLGLFNGGFADVAVLSHEVAEWVNDPFGTNLVRPWSVPQYPGVCFSDLLEVGDAIEYFPDPTFTVALHGVTYHLQDLAFFSWFTGAKPSVGMDGRYSYLSPAKLKSPAKFCN